jgi:hypothetical protein
VPAPRLDEPCIEHEARHPVVVERTDDGVEAPARRDVLAVVRGVERVLERLREDAGDVGEVGGLAVADEVVDDLHVHPDDGAPVDGGTHAGQVEHLHPHHVGHADLLSGDAGVSSSPRSMNSWMAFACSSITSRSEAVRHSARRIASASDAVGAVDTVTSAPRVP